MLTNCISDFDELVKTLYVANPGLEATTTTKKIGMNTALEKVLILENDT
jgi:hypothetical protein